MQKASTGRVGCNLKINKYLAKVTLANLQILLRGRISTLKVEFLPKKIEFLLKKVEFLLK